MYAKNRETTPLLRRKKKYILFVIKKKWRKKIWNRVKSRWGGMGRNMERGRRNNIEGVIRYSMRNHS